MQLTLDDFDTKILEVPSYKVSIESAGEVQDLSKAVINISEGFITCFTPFNALMHRQMSSLRFDLISLRCEYSFCGITTTTTNENTVRVWDQLKDPIKITNDEWDALIVPVASVSRYAKDSYFDMQAALSIYYQWILNSLHGYASAVFCASVDGKLAGLLTLKPKNDDLYIDLLSVSTDFQSKGVGTALLEYALSTIADQKKLMVITEGENLLANRFYQGHGFRLKTLQCVYHYHVGTQGGIA